MKHILAGIDFSETTPRVLEAAKPLAKAFGCRLSLLHIYAPEPEFVGYEAYVYPGIDEREQELRKEKQELRRLVDDLRSEGINADAYMKEAPIVSGILEFVHRHDCDLVILGSHGHGALARLILGSVTEGVVREADLPVLVVPTEREKRARSGGGDAA